MDVPTGANRRALRPGARRTAGKSLTRANTDRGGGEDDLLLDLGGGMSRARSEHQLAGGGVATSGRVAALRGSASSSQLSATSDRSSPTKARRGARGRAVRKAEAVPVPADKFDSLELLLPEGGSSELAAPPKRTS